MIFQYNYKYASHVREKLVKANKCLHVIRTLRQEGYNQEELDYLFQSIVMPNFLYRLSVYGAFSSDPKDVRIQLFLDGCLKRRVYIKEIEYSKNSRIRTY